MQRLWTKSFFLLTAGNLFLFVAFYMLYPTMPLFIKQIGGNESQAGLAMGAFMLSAVAFRPVVGGLLDRFGRRPFVIGGLLLFMVTMYLYDWVGGILVLLGLRVLHGMTWAVSTTSTMTAVTDLIPPARRGEGVGWFSMSMTVAMAVGPMLGVWVSQDQSFSALFWVAVALSAAALLLIVGVPMPFMPRSGRRKIKLLEKPVLPVAAVVFFLFIAYGGITTFVPLFADSIRVNSGSFFLTYAATLALIRPIAGKISDRRGEAFVIVPSLIVTVGALLTLGFANGLVGVLVSATLFGIGFGSAQPALQASALRLARADRIGAANATVSTATDLGIGLGAIALGWVFQYTSYQVLFMVSAVSVMVSFLLFTVFVRQLSESRLQS